MSLILIEIVTQIMNSAKFRKNLNKNIGFKFLNLYKVKQMSYWVIKGQQSILMLFNRC